MERMAARKSAGRKPRAPEGAVPLDGLERILRAGRRKAAGGRQSRREDYLVAANDGGQGQARDGSD